MLHWAILYILNFMRQPDSRSAKISGIDISLNEHKETIQHRIAVD
jgi:hypothetical protein